MTKYAFYTTEGCHLCEQAWELVTALGHVSEMTRTEIIDDEVDIANYGIRIPVIKNNVNDKEIGWPFDSEQLADFIAQD